MNTNSGRDAPVFEGGSGNVFADLGLPNAENRHAKSQLAMAIGDTIAAQRLTQRAAAFKVGEGLTQADVSHILHGRLRGYSVERLMDILTALGNDVSVSIRPTRDGGRGTFEVHGEPVVALAACSAKGD